VRWLGAALVALVLTLAGCGGETVREPSAPARGLDDAFVVRLYAQQQAGAELVRAARARLREPAVKRLATEMRDLRERRLAELAPLREAAGAPEQLAELGVSRAQAAEDIRPDALESLRPLTAGFLALMARHDGGAIALARAELERGRDPKVKAIARAVVVEYTRELERITSTVAELQQTE
jgi:uncharacterized protein (DUF305 family)